MGKKRSVKKTYADTCLERAEKATEGPWKIGYTYHHARNAEFIAHARTDVPELARRLKKACEALRQPLCWGETFDHAKLADELEAGLEEK